MIANSAKPTVVLVHGAFADASGFAGIIRELQSAACAVYAPPNPERGLAFDADTLKPFVAAIDGPVVLVGHSYGGAVITQASAGLSNVVGLVYLAGFGLDTGESVAAVQAPFAPPLLAANGRATPYDAVGAAGGPDLSMPQQDRDAYEPGSGLDSTSIDVFDSQERAYTQQVAAKGYDTMTGVGTPNGAAFITELRRAAD